MTSEEIRALRKKHGMTQDELALRLGVTKQTVANWENDRVRPSRLAIRQLERLERR